MGNKRLAACIMPVILFFFSVSMLAFASEAADYLPKGQVIDDDFIAAGQSVDIEGTVKGDVIATGGMVNFSGKSLGDVLAAGGNLQLNGETDGNIRAAGGNMIINGNIGKNITVAGGNIVLGENSTVEGNAYLAGGVTEIKGAVNKNLKVAGGNVILAGMVKGNAEIMSDNIVTRPGAKIQGNLTYYSNSDIGINREIVSGEIIRKNLPARYKTENSFGAFLTEKMFGFFGFLILSYVFFRIFTKKAKDIFASLLARDSWKMLAIGILVLILFPVSAIILMVTVIGIPLAAILIFLFVICVILAKSIASMVLGHAINNKVKPREFTDNFPLMDFVLGYLVLEVLMLIPFLGPLVTFLIFLWAFGGLVKHIYDAIVPKRAK